MMTATNIHYELGERVQGLAAGGIGAMLLVDSPAHPPANGRAYRIRICNAQWPFRSALISQPTAARTS